MEAGTVGRERKDAEAAQLQHNAKAASILFYTAPPMCIGHTGGFFI